MFKTGRSYSYCRPRTHRVETAMVFIDEILSLIREHEQWRQTCINLIPSENVTSAAVRSMLSSDFGHRYTSDDKFYMGTRFLDEMEMKGEELAAKVFNSETANLQPLSGHTADLIFLSCFTKPGDTILCVSQTNGGYPGIWKQGAPKFLQLTVLGFPFSRSSMNIDLKKTLSLMLKEKPRVVIFGASLFLFPHPVEKLAKAAREINAHIGYDGSHVLGLIAGRRFQDPLHEGASVLFGSTHKSFFGPQGGIILADNEHGEAIKSQIHPGLVDNAHWNRVAALTLALAEMLKFGESYAAQVVTNAQVLAKALAEKGFPVACPDLGYTKSHQVFLDFSGYRQGYKVARELEKANIIVDSLMRVGVCEVTRRGMKRDEMHRIAELMERVAIKGEKAEKVRNDVERLMGDFQEIKYCFE